MNRKCIIFVTAARVNTSMPLIQLVCGWIVLQSVPKSGFGKPNPSIYKHTMNVTPKICADHTLRTQADTQMPQTKDTKQSPLFCPKPLVTLPVTSSTHIHFSLSIKKRSSRHKKRKCVFAKMKQRPFFPNTHKNTKSVQSQTGTRGWGLCWSDPPPPHLEKNVSVCKTPRGQGDSQEAQQEDLQFFCVTQREKKADL